MYISNQKINTIFFSVLNFQNTVEYSTFLVTHFLWIYFIYEFTNPIKLWLFSLYVIYKNESTNLFTHETVKWPPQIKIIPQYMY